MTHIYKHRGSWRYRDANGKLCKFATEAEAKSSLNIVEPEEVEDASEEEEVYKEEDTSKKKNSSPTIGVSKKDSKGKSKKK
jgi:hypothetical protein